MTEDSISKMHNSWWEFTKFLEEITGLNQHLSGSFNLFTNLGGFEMIEKIEQYVENNPEIKITYCDDEVFSTSILIFVPHPTMGISVVYVPQLHGTGCQFFLYKNHYDMMLEILTNLKDVYKDRD